MADKGAGARAHASLVAEILVACGARPDCRIWANNTGVGRGLTGDGIIRFGLKGSADILGIYRGGRFIAIEVKTGTARQTDAQRAFQRMVEAFGGAYAVVRSAAEAIDFLNALAIDALNSRTRAAPAKA